MALTKKDKKLIEKWSVYWGERLEDLTHSIEDKGEEKILKLMAKEYKRSNDELKRIVTDLYLELLEAGEVSTTKLYQYNRAEKLSKAISRELSRLGEEQIEVLNQQLHDAFIQMAGATASEYIIPFSMPSNDAVRQLVATEWAGRHFKDSVWADKEKLLQALNKSVRDCIALGYSKDKAIVQIMSITGNNYRNASRLVRTELMHILNSANDEVAKQGGFKQKVWKTAKDERTCSTCGELENAVYPLEAETYSHPNCRCTFIYIK